MALGKNVKRIRINALSDVFLKISSTWTDIGKVLKGVLEDITDSVEITFADGDSTELDGKRKVKLTITLPQTAKDELSLVDSLRGATFECALNLGNIDGKRQCIYIKEIKPIPKLSLEIPGNPIQIVFEASAVKQSAAVSVTPSTGLPAGMAFTGADPIVGSNNYYVIVEESLA